ncbi:hypothetical protein B9T62_00670 [Paenibacillus donghaensis]|uniref:Beta-lactamase-related domain-containing protein n=2 Tax=Paenibacillus donghaensis TaxID=414771 RepID=A0A2Z2KFE9_9BACL|nr:hypothetical protein B9T62_00670 [Paenibacillus donghaensis]
MAILAAGLITSGWTPQVDAVTGTGGSVTALAAVPAGSTLTADQIAQQVDTVMNQGIEQGHIPGAALVVTQGDKVLYSKGYGYADVERQVPLDPAVTQIRVGSLTKSLTATAAMQLVEQGKLDLKSDINQSLTSFQIPLYEEAQPITLHELLTHTSGLDQSAYHTVAETEQERISADDFFREYVDSQPPVREPGVQFDYNNVGYGLVGKLIEESAGESLEAYMQEHLFRPLEMDSAALSLAEDSPGMPISYDYTEKGYQKISYQYLNIQGSGDLSLTPLDFAPYMIAHLNEGRYKNQSILSPSAIQQMHELQFTAHPLLDGFGYGFFRGELKNGLPMIYHTGEVEGFVSEMALIPSEKLGIFIVVNTANSDVPLHQQAIDAITGLLPVGEQGSEPVIQQTAGALEPYEGRYTYRISSQQGWGRWLRLFERAGFEVEAMDGQLKISGNYPDGSGGVEEKLFLPLAEGVFQEQGGQRKVWFHSQDGEWQMTGIGETTMDATSFVERPAVLLAVYAGLGLFWVIVLLAWLVRYVIRWVRSSTTTSRPPVSRLILLIASVFVIYLPVQLLYGLTRMIYGFSASYRLGLCSLPLIALAAAIALLVLNGRGLAKGSLPAIGRSLLALVALIHTGYLLYWNMLSVHLF